jgi:hypothetical protein
MLDSSDIGDSHVWVLLTRHIGKQYPAKTSKFIALHSVEYSNPVIAGVSPDLIGGKVRICPLPLIPPTHRTLP